MTRQQRSRTAVSAAIAAALLLAAPAKAQQALNFGTSSIGSVFYVISVGMSKLIGKYAHINVSVQPVGGSYPNLFALADKRVDLVMANSLSMANRFQGKPPFKKPFPVRIIAQGQPNFRVIIVRPAAHIRTVADLAGKILVGKRRALPELEQITDAMISVNHLDRSKIKIIGTVNAGQVSKDMRAGTVDAAVFAAAMKQPLLTTLFEENAARFIDLPEAIRDAMMKQLPDAFWPATLPAGSFPGQTKPAYVFGLYTAWVTRADLPDDVVYKLVKAVLGHTKEFATYHPAGRQWTPKNSLAHFNVPYHPGAIRYFKEIGAWTAKDEARQKALLAQGAG